MTPYYQDDLVTIYHGDVRDLIPLGDRSSGPIVASALVTDPPYGRSYASRKYGRLPREISGDDSTELRELVLEWWNGGAALVFGQWQVARPAATRAVLIWDAFPLGMGDLSIPWKPCAHEIYVLGSGFVGSRGSAVLTGFAPVQSLASNGRTHPNEKPVELMQYLVDRCPRGAVIDPFMGTGATLVAAKSLGRKAIGIEIEERYCEIAAQRCSQEVLGLA